MEHFNIKTFILFALVFRTCGINNLPPGKKKKEKSEVAKKPPSQQFAKLLLTQRRVSRFKEKALRCLPKDTEDEECRRWFIIMVNTKRVLIANG